MRVKAAITVASVLFAVGGGCSSPWQASNANVAPLNSPPYGQTRSSNSFDSRSQNPDGGRALYEPIEPCVGTATAACMDGRTQGQNDHHSGPGRLSIAAGIFRIEALNPCRKFPRRLGWCSAHGLPPFEPTVLSASGLHEWL